MSILKHEVVVVTTGVAGGNAIQEFRAAMPEEYRSLLVGPANFSVNGRTSFALLPVGDRDVWMPGGDIYKVRAAFIDFLKKQAFVYWAHVVLYDETSRSAGEHAPFIIASSQYDDNGNTTVRQHNDFADYELYEVGSMAVGRKFDSEYEAVAYILAAIVENGREVVKTWVLLRWDESGDELRIVEGDELVAYALRRGMRRD